MDYQTQTSSASGALPQGFSIFQPAPGAQVQFFPALGSQELDDLLHAYLPGPNPISDKRAAVTIDFFQQSQIDGQTFRFYQVDSMHASSPSPVTTTTTSSPAQSASSSQGSFPATPNWDFSSISDASIMSSLGSSSKGRKSSKASSASSSRADFSSLPGMKIMTKDGLDVTNSASRGSKTKEQRDHAHLMRIIKACDSCRAKKVRCDPSHKRRSAAAPIATSSRPQTNRISKSASRSPVSSQPSPITAPALQTQTTVAVPAAASTTEVDVSLSFMTDLPGIDHSETVVANDFVFDDALWDEFMASEPFSAPEQGNMNTAGFGLDHNGLTFTESSAASSSNSSASPGWGPYYSDLSQASSTKASSPADATTDGSDALCHAPAHNDGTISPALLSSDNSAASSSDGVNASPVLAPRVDRSSASQKILYAQSIAQDDKAIGGDSSYATLQNISSIHTDVAGAEIAGSGVAHAGVLGMAVAASMPVDGEDVSGRIETGEVAAHTRSIGSLSSAQRVLEDPGKPKVDGVVAQALATSEFSTAGLAEGLASVSASQDVAALGGDDEQAPLEPVRDRLQQTSGTNSPIGGVAPEGAVRSDTGANTVRPCGTEDIITGLAPLSSRAVYLATTLLCQLVEVLRLSETTPRAVNSVQEPVKAGHKSRKSARDTFAGGFAMAPAVAVC